MLYKRIWVCAVVLLLTAAVGTALTAKEELGKEIFFDENLSINKNQACAACHAPEVGFTGPDSDINAHGAVYEGSIADRFGNRKPPSSAYATFSPILDYERRGGGIFVGGNFWDGRATGEKLGNPAADQAQGPFLNPLEQGLPDAACVVYIVNKSGYYSFYQQVWGEINIDWSQYDMDSNCAAEGAILDLIPDDRDKVNMSYDRIALSIAAYEASPESNTFTSKFDYYLDKKVSLTGEESKGLRLFEGKGKCSKCHTIRDDRGSKHPLFTDFTYDNLGVPRNPENPFYSMTGFNPMGAAWIDTGLGGFLNIQTMHPEWTPFARENFGMQKVPTLRNVDKKPDTEFVKAYSHNGYFKSLKEIVHFYNTRDVLPVCRLNDPGEKLTCWPLPELALNMNTKEIGNLGLSDEEENAIVAFLETLSDGYTLD
jgi:cytochrome c peroxidase